MRFQEWMIGKRVREIGTGDKGTVNYRRTFKTDNSPLPEHKIAVCWDNGEDLSISIDGVIFEEVDNDVSPAFVYQEITINGNRYKLVPIEE